MHTRRIEDAGVPELRSSAMGCARVRWLVAERSSGVPGKVVTNRDQAIPSTKSEGCHRNRPRGTGLVPRRYPAAVTIHVRADRPVPCRHRRSRGARPTRKRSERGRLPDENGQDCVRDLSGRSVRSGQDTRRNPRIRWPERTTGRSSGASTPSPSSGQGSGNPPPTPWSRPTGRRSGSQWKPSTGANGPEPKLKFLPCDWRCSPRRRSPSTWRRPGARWRSRGSGVSFDPDARTDLSVAASVA